MNDQKAPVDLKIYENLEQFFPGECHAYDKTARKARGAYYLWLFLYLAVLSAASFLSFMWPKNGTCAVFTMLLFMFSLGVLFMMSLRKDDELRYFAETTAETIKSGTWKWIMKAPPYDGAGAPKRMVSPFTRDVKNTLSLYTSMCKKLSDQSGNPGVLSKELVEIRGLDVIDRVAVYLAFRIDERLARYKRQAFNNKIYAGNMMFVSVVLNILAFFLICIKILDFSYDLPVGFVTTLAGGVVAWTHAKSFGELHHSYILKANSINMVKEHFPEITDDKGLSDLVTKMENIFYAERTR